MWYKTRADLAVKKELDYSKPIICDGHDEGVILLLIPKLTQKESYQVEGFNWLRLSDGGHNSSTTWYSPQEAVEAYKGNNPRNAEITVK